MFCSVPLHYIFMYLFIPCQWSWKCPGSQFLCPGPGAPAQVNTCTAYFLSSLQGPLVIVIIAANLWTHNPFILCYYSNCVAEFGSVSTTPPRGASQHSLLLLAIYAVDTGDGINRAVCRSIPHTLTIHHEQFRFIPPWFKFVDKSSSPNHCLGSCFRRKH